MPDGPQGIGKDLSDFIQTLKPKSTDHDESHPSGDQGSDESGDQGSDGSGNQGSDGSGDKGIGDQVSAKAHELQQARTDDGPQGIGKELSAFVHSILPKSTDQEGPDPSGDQGSDHSGDHGIGDQVSAKAHELQDARTTDGSQGIGKELSAFVHSILPKTDSDVDNGSATLTAADQNGSSEAPDHSPVFGKDSSTEDDSAVSPELAMDGFSALAAAMAYYYAMPTNAFDQGKEDQKRRDGRP
jgi:hypothetical protein